MSQLRFEPCDPEVAPASALLAEMTTELNREYGSLKRLDVPAVSPADLRPPGGCYLVAYREEGAVAGGGLRPFEPGVSEIKRMYVVPAARSQGIATSLLHELETMASALGYQAVCLDTGPKQQHALRLYRSAGYVEVPPFNDNPYACFWGKKMLADEPG